MRERGQASIEWLGAVALVALVLAAAAGVAGPVSGEAVAGAVVRQMHRALCVVRGGQCDLDREPCVVAANGTEDEAHVNLGIVRLGRHELVLREHRSDGRVLVTYLHETAAGVEGGVGADLSLDVAGRDVAVSATLRAALLASLGGGQTWSFASAREADAGMAYLGEGRVPPQGTRVERIASRGAELEAVGRAEAGGAGASLRLDAGVVDGTIVDEASGRRTHVIRRRAAAGALVELPGGEHGASGGAAGEERVSVTTDVRGRPLALTVARTGELGGALSLPAAVQAMAGRLLGGTAGHRRWVVEQRLDLTEPANLRAAQAMLDALGGPAAAAAQADGALRARLAEAGVTEARTYDVASEDGGGASGHLALGLKVGGGVSDRAEQARLVAAVVRAADGVWRAKSECLSSWES